MEPRGAITRGMSREQRLGRVVVGVDGRRVGVRAGSHEVRD